MSHTFSRQELFDLVWTEPTRTIAKRLGISDVGLAKAYRCRRADLLLPPRGYWAQVAAGKRVKKPTLPARAPGMSDRIVLGRDRWNWEPDTIDLSYHLPVPAFAETLDGLASRVRKQIGTVRRTRDLQNVHYRVQKLLDADELRRTRQAASPYPTFDAPVFVTSFEKRRLRILNSLFRALDRVSVSVSVDGREARTLVAHVGDGVSFTVDQRASGIRSASAPNANASGSMRCELMALCGGDKPVASWTDDEAQPLEARLLDIAVAIVVHGERLCRASAHHHREWVIQRKAEIAEEKRRKDEEQRRLERERRRLEKARVARLLGQARALRQATRFARTLLPFETCNLHSTTLSVMASFEIGQRGRWRKRIDGTRWYLVRIERSKTMIERPFMDQDLLVVRSQPRKPRSISWPLSVASGCAAGFQDRSRSSALVSAKGACRVRLKALGTYAAPSPVGLHVQRIATNQ